MSTKAFVVFVVALGIVWVVLVCGVSVWFTREPIPQLSGVHATMQAAE